MADLEAVGNITVTGTRWLAPGQQRLQPVDLPISWSRLPPEAELRVGIRIVRKSNVRVEPQQGEVAAIVFGTPPGHCPPGEARQRQQQQQPSLQARHAPAQQQQQQQLTLSAWG